MDGIRGSEATLMDGRRGCGMDELASFGSAEESGRERLWEIHFGRLTLRIVPYFMFLILGRLWDQSGVFSYPLMLYKYYKV